jgi:hypothetical protein
MTDQCGNPLLRDWVKEWMEEFQKMGAKNFFYTYKRVSLNSLKYRVKLMLLF